MYLIKIKKQAVTLCNDLEIAREFWMNNLAHDDMIICVVPDSENAIVDDYDNYEPNYNNSETLGYVVYDIDSYNWVMWSLDFEEAIICAREYSRVDYRELKLYW